MGIGETSFDPAGVTSTLHGSTVCHHKNPIPPPGDGGCSSTELMSQSVVDSAIMAGPTAEPGWRNGRRGGLKIRCPQGRVGSSPTPGTKQIQEPRFLCEIESRATNDGVLDFRSDALHESAPLN